MTKIKKFKTLEKSILNLQKEAEAAPLSIKDILHILAGRGRPLILIVLCFPFCLPLQIPGLSTPFGLAIAFIGLRMSFGKEMWLPKTLLAKKIKKSTLKKITEKILSILKKMRRWIRPRLDWLCHSSVMHILNGIIIFLLGIVLALPLPIPLSNLVAAWSIFFIALGILEDDGVFVLIGYLITLLTAVFLFLIAVPLEHLFSSHI